MTHAQNPVVESSLFCSELTALFLLMNDVVARMLRICDVIGYLGSGEFDTTVRTDRMKEDTHKIRWIVNSSTLENTLKTITSLGDVSVSREDHSTIYDKTGKETAFLKLIYCISFIGLDVTDDLPSLSVEGYLNTISANIVTENNLLKKDLVIRLTTSHPSGSKNFMLYVV